MNHSAINIYETGRFFNSVPALSIRRSRTSPALTNKAIYDASGNLLLSNPDPGGRGLGIGVLRGPAASSLMPICSNASGSRKSAAPIFANPDTNINSATFGLINATAGDGRRFTLGARPNFLVAGPAIVR